MKKSTFICMLLFILVSYANTFAIKEKKQSMRPTTLADSSATFMETYKQFSRR